MRFGAVPVAEAVGARLAHAVTTAGGTLRKGTLVTGDIARAIAATGAREVIVARLDADDLGEDEAAGRLAAALAGPGVTVEAPATGRSNLFSARAGLLEIDTAAVDRFNRIDPAITLATRPPLRAVEAGRMVATVKIIPFAVPQALVAAAEAALAGRPALSVTAFRPHRVAVVSTLLPSLKPSVVDKTLAVLGERLAPAGAAIAADIRVPHEAGALAAALGGLPADVTLVVVFGASAVVDADDVLPAGLAAAGGRVIHLGMPVDPGNLLMLGERQGLPVLGAPGCARSPRENGFDFVLERVLAGRMPTAADIMGMGVGGLLMDIVSRPAPRLGDASREDPDRPAVGAVVLAAGRSSRFAGGNKLTTAVEGLPMVRRAANAALGAGLAEVVVVTGHEADAVAASLDGLPLRLVHNPDFAAGQSTSLKAGLAALSPAVEAAVVLLADMPRVDADTVRRIVAAYRPAASALVVVPTHEGRRGNPVLWSRRFFPELMALEGDTGARGLFARLPDAVTTVEAGPGILQDVDTREALAGLAGQALPD